MQNQRETTMTKRRSNKGTRQRARRGRDADEPPAQLGKLSDRDLRAAQEKTARDVKDPATAAANPSGRLRGKGLQSAATRRKSHRDKKRST
jgi:hypothetical protein